MLIWELFLLILIFFFLFQAFPVSIHTLLPRNLLCTCLLRLTRLKRLHLLLKIIVRHTTS